jgi:hypothetical protein
MFPEHNQVETRTENLGVDALFPGYPGLESVGVPPDVHDPVEL